MAPRKSKASAGQRLIPGLASGDELGGDQGGVTGGAKSAVTASKNAPGRDGHGKVELSFGPDSLNPYDERPVQLAGGRSVRQLRDQVRRGCPAVPGVYGMFNGKGELIYVGKSHRLRNRLMSYFSGSASQEKAGRIIERTRAIQWETQPSDFAARVRELGLIRRWTPRFNVQGVPQRQRPVYLCLGRKPAETFFLSSQPPGGDIVAMEGPFYGAGRMRRVVESLNKVFGLRDCSQSTVFQFAEQLSLFDVQPRPGCLRLEIGNCLGPCAAACTRGEYAERVSAAESFLDGFNQEPVLSAEEAMHAAAADRQYELAAHARDTLRALRYASGKLQQLAEARRTYSFIYAATGYDGQTIWYLIRRAEIVDAAVAPKTAAQYRAVKPLLRQWDSQLQLRHTRAATDHPYTVAIVSAWFRKHPGELKQTFAPLEAGRRYHRTSHLRSA